MSADEGKIVTVDGRVDPEDLSVILPHEHIFFDGDSVSRYDDSTSSAYAQKMAAEPISLENLWWIRTNPWQHDANTRLDSFEEAVEELSSYRQAGGDAVVHVTPKNCGGDPVQVRRLSRETGLSIVQGTAYYTEPSHPEQVSSLDVDELTAEFVSDVLDGVDDTRVRAGLIGEIGLSNHIQQSEETVLRAAARAALETGASISVHPPGRTAHSQRNRTYPTSRWGHEVLDIVEEEGLTPSRVILCHMDRTQWYEDLSYQEGLADRGAYVEYDLFGNRQYLYRERYTDANPSDVQRVDRVVELIDAGYRDRLLLSHDICLKTHFKRYGGFGYSHILENVLPIFEGKGYLDDALQYLLGANPRRVLTFR